MMHAIGDRPADVIKRSFIPSDGVGASHRRCAHQQTGGDTLRKDAVFAKYHMVMDRIFWIQYCVVWPIRALLEAPRNIIALPNVAVRSQKQGILEMERYTSGARWHRVLLIQKTRNVAVYSSTRPPCMNRMTAVKMMR